MLNGSGIKACFEHSHLLTVNAVDGTTNPIKGRSTFQKDDPQTVRYKLFFEQLCEFDRSEIRLRAF